MHIFDNRHIFTFLQSIFRKFVYHEMTLTKCRVIATYNVVSLQHIMIRDTVQCTETDVKERLQICISHGFASE